MKQLEIFAPATVANVSCGYDAMGFALEALGDRMRFTTNDSGQVSISKIEGATLPFEVEKNAAGVVAKAMLEQQDFPFGVAMEIFKNYAPGSGLGSSAASAGGAAYAINQLLGNPYSNLELVQFAMLGEEAACGTPIADNVSGVIYGGFVLIHSYEPLQVVPLPVPKQLRAVVVHPQIEIRTEDARKVVPKQILTEVATWQWARVGGLVSGLYESNYERIGHSLVDRVAEPHRKALIPLFDAARQAALDAGALGGGISGSGPAIFALCQGDAVAEKVAKAMEGIYADSEIEYTAYTSKISQSGAHTISTL